MEKHIRKIVSALLCMSMLLTVASPCFAAEEGTNGSRSYFDFEASEYEVGENDGELKIKIVRHGEGNAEADVAFKVADFLSSYGEDYAVLDGKGKQLQKVYGEKPSVSDLVYEGNTDELVNIPSADEIKEEESAQGAADEDVPEAVEESGDALEEETTIKEADSDETAQVAEVAETEEALPENLDKKAKSTGSSLRDAQSAYLNITKSEENKETESAIKDTLDDLYNYFLSAEGAEGKVHFKKGQNEKTITIKLFDNNVSEQDKIFLIALMGTDNDETMIAANATTYVTIIDDEKVEKSQFDLAEEKITLTKDAPEAYVTVRRSGGTQYFATVYVSTVKNTADEDAYEGFDYKPVAFVPGETEKKVKITAKSFDKDAGFGLRLEAESAYDIGNHYTAVKISQKSEAQGETAQKGISLMAASNVTLGSSSDTYDTDIPGGWESEIEIKTSPFGGRKVPSDGKAWVDEKNGNLCVMNKDVNKRSVWISKEEQNLIGVKNVTFRSRTWNFSNRPKKIRYWTVFEVGSSCNTLYGNSDWGERTLSRGSKDSGYISFWVRPKETGDNDPAAELDWVRFNNALYTFNLNNSLETVKRKMYDFTQGSPKEYDILFDGESTRIYNPGGITIYRNNGDTVSSFYSNNTEQVTIRSSKEAANNRNGIYLKGVYFTYSDMSDSNMYKNGKYATNNVYYLAASGGAVKFTPNKDFIKTLYDYGVIACKDCDKTIKIYPVFGQDTVWVNFENTDRDDKNAATKGKFDSSHKCSFIDNILEACNSGKVTKCLYNGWLDYYTMSVPKGSIIRVRTMPISTRTANGVHWWYHSGSNNGTTYHKAGDKIASATVVGGEPVTETKYDIADIYAGENLSMKPVTGAQTVDVAYYPKEKDYIPEEYKGEDGLKNAVIVSNALTGSSQEVKGTDKNGDYTVPNPQIGMLWSFTAFAPEGYYTQWVNMTGDENKDGEIDAKEAANLRYDPDKKYNMPLHVYGNRISGKLDQDNLRLNYFFLPKTSGGRAKKTGRVVRAPENFYELANHLKSSAQDIPVDAAYVDVGGFIGMTDADGRYSIDCNDLPSVGEVSTTIITADGFSYNTVSQLQMDTHIKLNALSKFNVASLKASYEKTKGAIADTFITVEDDKLNIEAGITADSAIRPEDVRFFIYDEKGNEKYALNDREGYNISHQNINGVFITKLSFNPKQDMQMGYRLYVQFADQNGEWTNRIDLGYFFASSLNLEEFIFPLIGSSSLENALTTGIVADIIGNPLADIELGKLKGFEKENVQYTPENISLNDANAYTWTNTEYHFGWSKKINLPKPKSKDNANDKDKDKEKAIDNVNDALKAVNDGSAGGAKPSGESKFKTKSNFSWSITPHIGFNLTLSTRHVPEEGKICFEDLVFYVKVNFDVSSSNRIQLPIGLSILIDAKLDGSVAGIYHMYVDYQDDYETEGAVPFTSKEFGLFKSFNSPVRREGYIFIDPKVSIAIGIGVGIAYVTGNATFTFDMDFQFTEDKTNMYGDVKIDLGWGIKVFGFTVYSKSLYDTTLKMFNSEGTNGHINLDYNSSDTLKSMSLASLFAADEYGEFALDKPSSRAYLANRSGWLGENKGISLMSIDASEGTVEKPLMNGVPENPYISLAELGNGKVLMVFINDDTERSNENKRAVYYSIYDGGGWSAPVIIDNDGTLDDYPNIADLGDGRLLITWSSADKVLEDGATVEDALKSMNIKAAFFDKKAETLGEVMNVTKTTEGDYCADTMANAAYDAATDRLILYYTKTEYDGLQKVDDFSTAYSVNAYMFYENGKWSDADDYTAKELEGAADVSKYKDDWYGQRFLDVRIDKTGELPRVVDTTSIDYNGLALFAWTVDWDKDLNTLYDRDVFMQIYNFSENSFTHIIRVTPESSAYTTPKFERSNDATYLFFGETPVTDGSGIETELSEHGVIKYLNVSKLIKNDRYTKITDGTSEYYIFQYELDGYTLDENDNPVPFNETVIAEAGVAAECDNPMDYDVKVADDGKMYLFWTDAVDGARQIMTAVYNGNDNDDEDDLDSGSNQDTDISLVGWSEPLSITNADRNEYYSGIGATAVDGTIIAVAAKGNYADESNTSLVWEKHTPFAKVKVTDIAITEDMPRPLSTVTLSATVKNEGLNAMNASEEAPIAVTFTINGADLVVTNITEAIPGGAEVTAECNITLPEDISDIEFAAYINEAEKATVQLETNSFIELTSSKLERIAQDGYEPEKVVYTAVLENNGNKDASNITVKATVGDTEVGSKTFDLLSANDREEIKIELSLSDGDYAINNDGVGWADVDIEVTEGNEKEAFYSGTVKKAFSAEAIDALSKVTGVSFSNNGTYSMNVDEEKDIQPTIQGADEGSLMVMWLESSDTNIAYINYDNMIVANGNGTATFTGIVVPAEEKIEFISGYAQKADWKELIPSDKLITVTMNVRVGSTGGHSSSSSVKQQTLTLNAANGSETGTIKVNKNGTISELPTPVKEGYKFEGWYTDEALTIPFTQNTKVTEDLQLYAKWTEDTDSSGNKTPFKDISAKDWYYDAVKYAYESKLFSGISDDTFAPNDSLTRAMLVTVLWRAADMPAAVKAVSFGDVDADGYYAEALNWATDEGIVMGISDNEFAPDENITREQIAAIIFRYAKQKGIVPEGDWAIQLEYNDIGDISDWAVEAVMFCKLKGIMLGDDMNSFNPKNNATRAETAAIAQRFLESLKND